MARGEVVKSEPTVEDDEPGFDVVVKVVRTDVWQPTLYFRRITPQWSTDICRWQQLNNNPTHAGTAGTSRWSWEAVKELGEWWLYREEKKVTTNDGGGFEVGDLVDVRGKVVRVVPDKVLVSLYSNYSGPVERWFMNDQVTLVTKAVDADEPPPGALVEVETKVGGKKRYYLRTRSEDAVGPRWYQQGGEYPYSPITWRTVKATGKWTRLYREDEI